ncbi:Uncharacterised protein [Bordetella trematum]|uniref:hypothetical protein n=1 Tax=Bordetella trematum TaxID=123899 RepID=UPI000E1747C3|nr:hypothetical protein [Bordetella trematum]SUX91963.1 Uncharacterised protein [Bordetella trematum]
MTTKLSVDQAFDRDIPAEHRDDVMQMICEAAQADGYHPQHVSILDRTVSTRSNWRAEGILTFGGRNSHSSSVMATGTGRFWKAGKGRNADI